MSDATLQPQELTDDQKLVVLRLSLAHALRLERHGLLCEHEPADEVDRTARVGVLSIVFLTFGYALIVGQALGAWWWGYALLLIGCISFITVGTGLTGRMGPRVQRAFMWLIFVGWPLAFVVEIATGSLNPWITHGLPVAVFLIPFLVARGFGLRSARELAVTLGALAANAPLLVPVALIVLFVPLFSSDLWRAADAITVRRGLGLVAITVGLLVVVLRRQLKNAVRPAFSAVAAQIEWSPDPVSEALDELRRIHGNETSVALLDQIGRDPMGLALRVPNPTTYAPYIGATLAKTFGRRIDERLVPLVIAVSVLVCLYIYALAALAISPRLVASWLQAKVPHTHVHLGDLHVSLPSGPYVSVAALLGLTATAVFLAFTLTEEKYGQVLTEVLLRKPIMRALLVAVPYVMLDEVAQLTTGPLAAAEAATNVQTSAQPAIGEEPPDGSGFATAAPVTKGSQSSRRRKSGRSRRHPPGSGRSGSG